jgi:hypothetical protein
VDGIHFHLRMTLLQKFLIDDLNWQELNCARKNGKDILIAILSRAIVAVKRAFVHRFGQLLQVIPKTGTYFQRTSLSIGFRPNIAATQVVVL